MKTMFSDVERSRLESSVAATEKKTGTQIVPAVIRRSDSYVELPWIAFALGAGLVGLLLVLLDLPLTDWRPQLTKLLLAAVLLTGGALFALLTVLIPPFARLFLSDNRAELEVRQYASTFFLERELFTTKKRRGILLLVSIFERKVVILTDTGLNTVLTAEVLEQVIRTMIPLLKKKKIAAALEAGLREISNILGPATGKRGDGNELPDHIIEEEGA